MEKLSDKYKSSDNDGSKSQSQQKQPLSQPPSSGKSVATKPSAALPYSSENLFLPSNSVSYIQRIIGEPRENFFMLLIGETGVGKSWAIISLARGYAQGNPVTGRKARIAFIFDSNGEPEYAQAFPNAIIPSKITSITRPDVYRILPIKDNGELMDDEEIQEAMIYVAKNAKRAALFFDDLDNFFEGAKPRSLTRLFTGFRHRGGRDVIFIHQRWSAVIPKERAAIKYIQLRHTSESVEMTKERWKNPQIMLIAENIVEEQYDLAERKYLKNEITKDEYKRRRSFYVDIDVRLNKIIGAYSRKCFIRNCKKYLNAYPNLISRYQKVNCDKNGDIVLSREEAIEGYIREKLLRYFAGKE